MELFFIYKIECIVNKKVYIGQTKALEKRWKEHKNDLRNNRHHSILLQRAWNKYGEDNFVHSLIEICSIDIVDEKEVNWINYYDSSNKRLGFNIEGGGNANKVVSEDTRKKQSIAKTGSNNPNYGITPSDETIKKRSIALSGENNPMYGKTPKEWMDEDTYTKWVNDKSERMKGSNNHMYGKRVPDERKQRYSELFAGEGNPFYGKSHTDEVKETIRKLATGRVRTEESRRKQGLSISGENNHFYGKHHSEETKEKLREKRKTFRHSEETKANLSEMKKGNKHPQSKYVKVFNEFNQLLFTFNSCQEAYDWMIEQKLTKNRNSGKNLLTRIAKQGKLYHGYRFEMIKKS